MIKLLLPPTKGKTWRTSGLAREIGGESPTWIVLVHCSYIPAPGLCKLGPTASPSLTLLPLPLQPLLPPPFGVRPLPSMTLITTDVTSCFYQAESFIIHVGFNISMNFYSNTRSWHHFRNSDFRDKNARSSASHKGPSWSLNTCHLTVEPVLFLWLHTASSGQHPAPNMVSVTYLLTGSVKFN